MDNPVSLAISLIVALLFIVWKFNLNDLAEYFIKYSAYEI